MKNTMNKAQQDLMRLIVANNWTYYETLRYIQDIKKYKNFTFRMIDRIYKECGVKKQ